MADALDYAHSQGVLHRDIKPSNLLLDNQSTVWVTDFGLAKGTAADGDDLTHTGDIVGTLRYMSPERFQGQSGAGGDIYSLGLTLYEMLALRPAFNETDHKRLIQQVTHEEPPRPRKLNRAIPRDLETIILKATEREPGRRYQTPKAMAEDLQRFLEDKPIRARQASRTERLWRWCRRNPALATAMTVAAAAMVAVTIFAVLFAVVQAKNAEEQARANNALSVEKDRAEKLASDLAVALKDTRNHEALLAVEKGHMLIGQGQLYPGMLWLCRGLEKAPSDAVALQDSIRTSLVALRSEAPVLRLVLSPGDGAKAAVFRPDGKAIVIGGGPGGGNGEARLWDAATGKPLGPPLPHPEPVHVVAFSPNGATVLTGSGIYAKHTGEARLWDAASGKLLAPPMTLSDRPWAVAFSSDGKKVLTGTADFQGYTGEVRLWDAHTGKPLCPPLVQAGPLYAVAFSPDGKSFAAASWNPMSGKGVVGFWDTATVKPLGRPFSDNVWIGAIGFAPDGKTIAMGTGEVRTRKGEVRFLDIAGRRLVGRPLPHTGIVSSVAFSPDGQLVLTGSLEVGSNKGDIRLWEAATGKLVGMPIPQQGTLHASFSPDGRRILSTGYGKSSYVWELPTDRLIGPLLSHHEPVSAVAFGPVVPIASRKYGTPPAPSPLDFLSIIPTRSLRSRSARTASFS